MFFFFFFQSLNRSLLNYSPCLFPVLLSFFSLRSFLFFSSFSPFLRSLVSFSVSFFDHASPKTTWFFPQSIEHATFNHRSLAGLAISTVLLSFPAPQPASFILFCFPIRFFFFQFFARVTRISEQNDRCFIAHEESVSASLSCDRPRNATYFNTCQVFA